MQEGLRGWCARRRECGHADMIVFTPARFLCDQLVMMTRP